MILSSCAGCIPDFVSLGETGMKSQVTLAKRRGELDFAILEAAKDHLFTASTDSNNLRGRHLVLASHALVLQSMRPCLKEGWDSALHLALPQVLMGIICSTFAPHLLGTHESLIRGCLVAERWQIGRASREDC